MTLSAITTVFVVQHVHAKRDGEEDVKFIGVYSSGESASAAISRLAKAPGFRDSVGGFCIDAYELDADHWVDGFAEV